MSASHGCNDDKAVIELFKEALKQRVGQEVYQAWFADGVFFELCENTVDAPKVIGGPNAEAAPTRVTQSAIVAKVRGQFALDRLSRNYTRELRGAAMQAFGRAMEVQLRLADPPQQVQLPIDDLSTEALPDNAESETGRITSRQNHSASDGDGPADAGQPGGHATNISNQRRTRAATPSETRRRKSSPRGGESIASLVQQSQSQNYQSGKAKNKSTRSRRRKPNLNAVSLTQPTLPNLPANELKQSAATANAKTDASHSKVSGKDEGNAEKQSAANSAQQRMTLETFVGGKCNQLARTAAQLVCENPQAGSPLFVSGPPGVGKTHLMFAISHFLRRHHRMRRVMHLSAEKFTNDFIRCVSSGTLTSFRSLYRDIDAFILDDVQFLGAKKATLREMLYTVESLMDRGKTLIFAATHSPNEISGLTQELSGRLSSGLVCTMQTLDTATRETLLRQSIDEKCLFPWPEETIREISQTLPGDGRRIGGFVNLISVLQRMYDRMPTTAEIQEFGGDQLRSDKPFVTMAKIERAVAQTFQLDNDALKSKSQARTTTEPRMLAMYLSRELTPAAFAEIGRYYGGRSHSAAILARRRVETWLASGKSVGRGSASLTARDALDRIESLLRSG
ncbi:DnaA ATPase domain-containing protein [Planctomycetes bacterium K23_9]|uniref:Chromosomal replication initiator protein DnaA n=1 Tax=Stieleria marina TaxID=1930275 RepID=A0A517NXK3_9BACT|nr:Chromosomal replication initiator protein DnaA [Planctomycetes bacterium K23_9]